MTGQERQYFARARNERTEHIVYGALARRERNPKNRALLEKMSSDEHAHYEFWRTLLPEGDRDAVRPDARQIALMPIVRAVFGLTFAAKILESHEKNSIEEYERILPLIPEARRAELARIIEDERSHERSLLAEIKERRVSYLGFVALGLSDAIVEITGVHAGFLGVTGSTLIAGIAGVIVGFSAAISMGAAAYLQAKQDPAIQPIPSAFITGSTYLCSVIFLALPYFLIRTMIVAFAISSTVGLLLLAAFTFYGAVVFDRRFIREFGESASLMMGTAGATYLLGAAVGYAFHVNSASF